MLTGPEISLLCPDAKYSCCECDQLLRGFAGCMTGPEIKCIISFIHQEPYIIFGRTNDFVWDKCKLVLLFLRQILSVINGPEVRENST